MLDRQNILKAAADRGFDLCGVVPCRHLAENEARFRNWLSCGYQSSLGYLERNTEKRFDPRLLVEGARTAVVCAVAYKNRASGGYAPECRTKVASYAAACDYHTTLRGMLHGLLEELRGANPDLRGRVFVDTAPLAEKQLAVEAGLGGGRGGGSGVDRPPVAARHPAIRHLRRAGRAASGPGSRQLRHPLCRVSLRDVPPLHRGMPHGSHSARPHDRHGALHRLPHHRTAARHADRPQRLDLRLRHLSERLPVERPHAATPQPVLRPALRPPVDGCRRMAGAQRGGLRRTVRPNAAHAQRSAADPEEHRRRRAGAAAPACGYSRMQRTGRPNPRGSVAAM